MWRRMVREYFAFSRRERKGLMVMVFMIITLQGIHLFRQHRVQDFTETDTLSIHLYSDYEDSMRKSNSAPFPSRPWGNDSARQKFLLKKDWIRNKTDHFRRKPNTEIVKFDLNIADSAQLDSIPFWSSALAGRYVRYREKLGGFLNMNQALEVYGMDSMAKVFLQKRTILHGKPSKLLALNQCSLTELQQHPYIGYKLGKVIWNYKLQHGPFNNLEDLRQIKIMNEDIIRKLEPYLTFEP